MENICVEKENLLRTGRVDNEGSIKRPSRTLKIFECGVHFVYFPTSLFFASVFSVSVLHTVITFKSGEVIIENYVSLQRS